MPSVVEPARYPTWNEAQLESDQQIAIARFIDFRTKAGDEEYRTLFCEHITVVESLFRETGDLHDLSSGHAFLKSPSLLRAARFLCAPFLSEDNLDTLVVQKVAKRKKLLADPAKAAAQIVCAMLDRERFPWLFEAERRDPTDFERQVAVRWTAGIWTDQAIGTRWRNRLAKEQQDAVRALLLSIDLRQVAPRAISAGSGIQPGEFSPESPVASEKCDVPVGLHDGRYLFLECKVSNSSTNSVKRLIRETAGKRDAWKTEFGNRAVIGAVIAGVYALTNLQDAQRRGLAIIWSHDLSPLAAFVEATRP